MKNLCNKIYKKNKKKTKDLLCDYKLPKLWVYTRDKVFLRNDLIFLNVLGNLELINLKQKNVPENSIISYKN